MDLGGVVNQTLQLSSVVYETTFPSMHSKTSGSRVRTLTRRLQLQPAAVYWVLGIIPVSLAEEGISWTRWAIRVAVGSA